MSSSQDLILRPSSSSSALSPLSLGLSAVFGYNSSYNSGFSPLSFASDLLSRLLFMLFERVFRSLESLATRYLDRLAERHSSSIQARLEAKSGHREGLGAEETSPEEKDSRRPQVLEAVASLNALPEQAMSMVLQDGEKREGMGNGPACPLEQMKDKRGGNGRHEPPPFAKRMMERRERWRNWMFAKTEAWDE